MAVERLQGGELLRLTNLHRIHRTITLDLPTDRPFVELRPPGCPWLDAPAELTSVALDMDQDLLALAWSAVLRVAGRYPPEELAMFETRVGFR